MDVNFQSKSPGLPKKTLLFIIPKLGFDICNTFLIITQRRNYKGTCEVLTQGVIH